MKRARRLLLVAAAVLLSQFACGREITGPGAGLRFASGLSFLAQFPGPLANVAAGAGDVVPFERVRIVFRRTDGSVALDTVVNFPSNADSIALDLRVPLDPGAPAAGEPMTLALAYVNAAGDTVFRGGPVPVVAQSRPVGAPPPPPAPVPLTYVGPGATAVSVAGLPDSITLVAGDPFTVTATAFDGQGAPMANVPLVFSSLDLTRATVTNAAAGAGITTSSRGLARIVVELPTGADADTTFITVLPRPSAVTLLSGGAQAGFTGTALPQNVVARLLATDGQPLAGANVSVAITSGGGSVLPAGGTTGAGGDFSFAWTLGPTIGAQSVTVSSPGATPLVVNATAASSNAVRLTITQQVGASYQAGDSITALLLEARRPSGARDTLYADSVFLGFSSAPAGATITGVSRVRADSGRATFNDFRLTRAGAYRMLVSASGLASDSSATITIAPRAASALALQSGNNQVAPPGTALPQPVVVRAEDPYGNPVAGVIVGFATSNGSLSAAADTTAADGLASVQWTLAVLVGPQAMTASAPGLAGSPRTITATGSAGIATTTMAPQLDTLTALGATRLLVATSRDGANGVVPGNYTWVSRNPAIATVNDTGRVTAVTNGATYVVATENGGTRDSARVVVQQRLATIAVTPDPRDIYLGASYAFSAQAVDGRGVPLAAQPSFTWSTGSSAIASITPAGVATGLGLGVTQVRATSGAVTGVAQLTVRTPITRIAVVRDSTGFVASDTFSLAALGRTRSYKAVAYDTLNAPMTGIAFAWSSSNPSVAPLDSTGSATARAAAAANGFTAVRATAQGITGAAALTVAQVMTSVEIDPPAASVAPFGSIALTARRRDANNYFIPGGAFTFASADGAIATVSASGVVTGVAIGSTTVTATSGAVTSAPAAITVTTSVPPVISFGRDTLAIGRSATNISIPVYLSRPNGSAVTVTLAVQDTIAFFNPVTITIPPGSTVGTASLSGRAAGSTRISAVDNGATGYAGDTAVLTVQAGVRFQFGGYTLLVNDEQPTQVILTDPAPAGGTYITYDYGTAGRASVSPDPAFIPAGQLSANVVIRATGAGGTTITPAAAGVTGTSTSVATNPAVLTIARPHPLVGAGQYRGDWYVYTPSNVNVGVPVTLSSSDTAVAVPLPAAAAIPGGSYYVYFAVRGKVPGLATIDAASAGWAGANTTLRVTTPKVGLSGGGTLNTTSPEQGLTVYSMDSTSAAHWRTSALAVTMTSSDTAVIRVNTPSVTINADQYFTSTPRVVPGGTPGTAWVRISASGHTPDSVQYTVVGPHIRFTLPAQRVGAGQYRPDGYVYTPDNVTAPLVVHLTSSNAGVAVVTDSVIIPANSYYAYYNLSGVAPGTVRINVSAAGYQPDSANFTVTTPRTTLSGGGTVNNFRPPMGITVYSADSTGAAHYASDTIITSFSSSDAAVVTVTAADTILPGQYYASDARVTVVGLGSAWVRVNAPGMRPDSVFYTVVTPQLNFSAGGYRLGRRQFRLPTDFYIYTPDNRDTPLNATITQTNAAIDSLTSTALTINAGSYYSYFGIAGLGTGVDTLIVSAPGYLPDTMVVTVTSPRLTQGGIPGSATTTSPPSTAAVYVTDSTGNAHYSLDTLLLSAHSSNDAVIQPESLGFRLPRGAYYVYTRVRYIGPGTANMTWSDSLATGYGSVTSNNVTVTGPALGIYNGRPILGQRQYGAGGAAYVSIPDAIGVPLAVHLVSTDPAVATVPDSVVIPPGQTYVYFDIRAQDVIGTVQIQASATGYSPTFTTQQVTAARFSVQVSGTVRTTQGPQTITVYPTDANGNAHYVWEPVTVNLVSSNPAAATVDSTSVVLAVGSYYNNSARLVPQAAGGTTITASDPRAVSYRYGDGTAGVSVILPTLAVSWGGTMRLGIGQWVEPYASSPDNVSAPLTVTVTHANGATSTAPTLTIPGSSYYIYHRITTLAAGTDTLTYSAPGYFNATGIVAVAPGRVDGIGGWPGTLATDSVAVTLYARDPDGNVRNVAVATTFDIGIAGGALEARSGGAASAVITGVTIPADASQVTFYLRRLANGTATVTFTNANYVTHVAPVVTVTGAP